MQVGNKQHATILGGVAVLALGFVIFQFLPKKASASLPPPSRAAASSTPSASATPVSNSVAKLSPTPGTGVGSSSPDEIGDEMGAAFGAPPAIAKKAGASRADATAQPTGFSEGDVPTGTIPMTLPPAEGAIEPKPKTLPTKESGTAPKNAAAPGEGAGSAGAVSVRVQATISAASSGKATAILKIDEVEVTVAIGDPVGPRWVLDAVRDESIVLRAVQTTPLSKAGARPQPPIRRSLALGTEAKL